MSDEPDISATRRTGGPLDERTVDALVGLGAAMALIARRVDAVEATLTPRLRLTSRPSNTFTSA
jgi:hypothetical protein